VALNTFSGVMYAYGNLDDPSYFSQCKINLTPTNVNPYSGTIDANSCHPINPPNFGTISFPIFNAF
jgi:hypothetical protein